MSHDWRGHVPERSHLVTLQGAKEPNSKMVFVFDAVDSVLQSQDTAMLGVIANIENNLVPLSVQRPGMLNISIMWSHDQ